MGIKLRDEIILEIPLRLYVNIPGIKRLTELLGIANTLI